MFNKINSTKINVIANFVGNLWLALLSIIFVPFFLHYLGIEAYGIIGFFSSIQAIIVLLDFGISPSFTREISRLTALRNSEQEINDLKRTLEVPNWISSILIALVLLTISPFIAKFWLQPKELSTEIVTQALMIISINIALQFSINFYYGGLMGLQKQLHLNLIFIICGTIRSFGSLMVLIFISPTIKAFLLWQGFSLLLQLVITVMTLIASLPNSKIRGRFSKEILQKIWRFAIGMAGISIVSLILSQLDKLILSKILNLENFGYYTLAITISSMPINMIGQSISHAVYPKFSQIVSLNDENALSIFYHQSCQLMSVLILPVMSILTFYSYDILLIWTHKEDIALNTYILLSLAAIGTGLNALMWLPYYMQLAHGWTKLALYMNIGAIISLIPLMILGVYKYGAIGGAVSWIVLNVLYILVMIQIMHRRILKGEEWKWYLEDLAIPLFVSFSIAGGCKLFFNSDAAILEIILKLLTISSSTLLITIVSTKTTRNYLMFYIAYLWRLQFLNINKKQTKI